MSEEEIKRIEMDNYILAEENRKLEKENEDKKIVIDYLAEQLEMRTNLTKEEWKRVVWDMYHDKENNKVGDIE